MKLDSFVNSKLKPKTRSLKKWIKPLFPFLLLIGFTLSAAGIFMAVDNPSCHKVPGASDKSNKSNKYGRMKFLTALHFITVTESSIGYGATHPCTQLGRGLALIFASLGIPIMLYCLHKVGSFLEKSLHRVWRNRQKLKFWRKNASETIDDVDYLENVIPLSLGLAITWLWVFVSSVYFYLTIDPPEANYQWNYFSAIYFTVITMLTIGLGDIVPEFRTEIVLPDVLVIFGGLSVMTMCLSIAERKFEALFDATSKSIRDQYNKAIQNAPADGTVVMDTGTSQVKKDVHNLVAGEKNKSSNNIWWYFMSKNKKEKLVELYQGRANMVNRQTQTERPKQDGQIQASVTLVENHTLMLITTTQTSSQYESENKTHYEVQTSEEKPFKSKLAKQHTMTK